MKARTNLSESGKAVLLTIYEGFSTYTVTIPLAYALRVFAEGLVTATEALKQMKDLGSSTLHEGEKAEIQELLRKAVGLYEDHLTVSGR